MSDCTVHDLPHDIASKELVGLTHSANAQKDAMGATAASGTGSWQARLNLTFDKGRDKTLLRREHNGPLMVQRPFYPEGDVCHCYLLHPPSGIVGGDELTVTATCKTGSAGLVTTPGANRYYGSDGRVAKQTQTVTISDAQFEWFPMETIFFDQCVARQKLDVNLSARSRFIGWDILCFGRPAGNHPYRSGEVTTRLNITIDQQPQLVERLHVKGLSDINRATGLRGNVVLGTMFIVAPECDSGTVHNDLLDLTRSAIAGLDAFAATQMNSIILIRYLGASAEDARNGYMQVWQSLRPAVFRREAVAPRIWAT